MKTTFVVIFLFFLFLDSPADAQELYVYGGTVRHSETGDTSYTWGFEYLEWLGEHSAFSISWLNEGHLPDDRRDGQSFQFWGGTTVYDQRLVLAAGIGPYFYYDTVKATDDGSRNTRGLAALFSLTATWHIENSWLIQLRANFVETQSSLDTGALAIGVGYQLDPSPLPGPAAGTTPQVKNTRSREIMLLAGRTIINKFDTPTATAVAVEYRQDMGRHLEWTIGWLSQGNDHRTYRGGPLTQLWLVRTFFNECMSLGAGAGVHIDFLREDPNPNDEKITTFAAVTSITAAYRCYEHWLVRLSWNRVITDYHRDADVIMGGFGYRF